MHGDVLLCSVRTAAAFTKFNRLRCFQTHLASVCSRRADEAKPLTRQGESMLTKQETSRRSAKKDPKLLSSSFAWLPEHARTRHRCAVLCCFLVLPCVLSCGVSCHSTALAWLELIVISGTLHGSSSALEWRTHCWSQRSFAEQCVARLVGSSTRLGCAGRRKRTSCCCDW